MRLSSRKPRVEVSDDGASPLPYTVTYSLVLDFECPRCGSRTSVLDDSQAYVRRMGSGRRRSRSARRSRES
jgi:hypothetical protein